MSESISINELKSMMLNILDDLQLYPYYEIWKSTQNL